jgi:hypothetical protein
MPLEPTEIHPDQLKQPIGICHSTNDVLYVSSSIECHGVSVTRAPNETVLDISDDENFPAKKWKSMYDTEHRRNIELSLELTYLRSELSRLYNSHESLVGSVTCLQACFATWLDEIHSIDDDTIVSQESETSETDNDAHIVRTRSDPPRLSTTSRSKRPRYECEAESPSISNARTPLTDDRTDSGCEGSLSDVDCQNKCDEDECNHGSVKCPKTTVFWALRSWFIRYRLPSGDPFPDPIRWRRSIACHQYQQTSYRHPQIPFYTRIFFWLFSPFVSVFMCAYVLSLHVMLRAELLFLWCLLFSIFKVQRT